jgi:hypothetical protein
MTDRDAVRDGTLGTLAWDRGRIEVQALGGMIGPVEAILDDGRTIRPFAVAPWSDEPQAEWEATAPPLLKRLRGDWVCLPFGSPGKPRTDLDPHWLEGLDADLASPDPAQHGTCANSPWRLDAAEPRALSFSFAPDAEFPIARIARRISVADGRPDIQCETRVAARAACELPWGVHPTFRLPEAPSSFEIAFGAEKITVLTFPGVFEPGVSRVAPAQVCDGLRAVPMADGSTRSFETLPLPFDSEELLLVTGHNGEARLTNRVERYRVVMNWDASVFPSVLLWVSNRGRRFAPWNGRFLGLGVEPVSSAFDLGYAHAVNPRSPLRALGVPTATRFAPERDLVTKYSFRFESV